MDNMEEYMNCLDIIAKTNHIEEVNPADAIKLPQITELSMNIIRDDESDDKDEDENKGEVDDDSFHDSVD